MEVPIEGAGRLSLRLYDPDSDKLRVVHRRRPYQAEYTLTGEADARLAAAAPFDPATVRDDVTPEPNRRSVAHHAYLAALALMLLGLLVRRR